MRTPKRLQPGDTIGLVSPSSPTTPQEIENMKTYFGKRGYRIQVAPNALARFGFMAGTPQMRADDFNLMLRDPGVRMVMTTMGGAGAAHLLPLIDYEAISADPKIVVGLSNPSILLNAISGMTGVPTFHGPNGIEFGGGCPLTRFCEENFWPMVCQDLDLPYTFPVSNTIQVLRGGGAVEGRLLGGHLRTNQVLLGTPWAPEWKDSILFIEEMDVELFRTDAMLAHLRLAGVFERIKGLIVGQYVSCDAVEAETLADIVLRNCTGYDFPIVSNIPIGHTDDKITVPIGCRVRLNPIEPSLELLETPTCP
jgi:muramoyltetrapeptide carboxypeptidase